MTYLNRSNSSKFDLTQNRSGGRMIKFQQSQALTSHFGSFWSIVHALAYLNENQIFLHRNSDHSEKTLQIWSTLVNWHFSNGISYAMSVSHYIKMNVTKLSIASRRGKNPGIDERQEYCANMSESFFSDLSMP